MSISVNNISKSIAQKKIIKDITFSLRENEIVALVGPNGSGKTTLLKLMATLLKLDKGDIHLNGNDIGKDRENYLKQISFMQDSSVLYHDLTGYDHLKFIAAVVGKNVKDISTVINELAIENYITKKVKTYSLGMKQHLLLAMAILSNPKLLLLDEPLNGLDPTSSHLLRNILFRLRSEGTTILFSSHILSEVDKVSDRVLFIKDGQLIHEDLNLKKGDVYQFLVSSPEEMVLLLKEQPYIIDIEMAASNKEVQLVVQEGHFNDTLRILLEKGIEIKEVQKKEIYSESIYQKLYEEKL